MSFRHTLSIQALLWPILDFLTKLDIVLIAGLCRDSRQCCDGYCLQYDVIDPKCLPGKFRYKKAIVHDLASLAQLPATLQSLDLGYHFNQSACIEEAIGILPGLQNLTGYDNSPAAEVAKKYQHLLKIK